MHLNPRQEDLGGLPINFHHFYVKSVSVGPGSREYFLSIAKKDIIKIQKNKTTGGEADQFKMNHFRVIIKF